MIMGIPTDAAVVAFIAVAVVAVGAGNLLLWLLLIPIGFICRMIAKKDARAFRQIGIWIDTKVRYPRPLKQKWGACSYALFKQRKLKR